MGDSYAAGIGAGSKISIFDEACFRYDGAYPVILNRDLAASKFNNVACSGDQFPAILQNQLADHSFSFLRPTWGDKPEFVTLTMGGNDIGFKELVTVCIYSLRIFTFKDCDRVLADSQARVEDPKFEDEATNVIIATLRKGVARSGPNFKVYVTGYAQFFNERALQCNDVSFKPRLSPFAKQFLTVDKRQTLNKIARDLNSVLRTAVIRASIGAPGRVIFIDYDRQFEGHRFCDRHEPNPDDPDTWFYTLGSSSDAAMVFLDSIPRIGNLMNGRSNDTISDREFFRLVSDAAGNDETKRLYGVATYRIFHPKPIGHRVIEQVLRSRMLADSSAATNATLRHPIDTT
ncbi:MAG: hypothetical protein Q9218_007437 [Villophora microphyllina]